LFIAAHDQAVIDKTRTENQTRLVKRLNERLVQQARTFVWSTNDSELAFVQRYFGKLPDRVILTDQQKKEAVEAINAGEGKIDGLISGYTDRLSKK
jgi:hypothetical protein